MASRGWRIVLAAALCFLKMATEVSAANILILHPLYAGSHDLVLRYVYIYKAPKLSQMSSSYLFV